MNTKTAALAVFSALTLTSCAGAISGVPVSPLDNTALIGGVAVTATDSGMLATAPAPTVQVQGTDGGAIDRLGALAVEDTETYWSSTVLPGGAAYQPVAEVTSWDARSGEGATVCNIDPDQVNAAFCPKENAIGWDRALMGVLAKNTGDLGAVFIVAHEIGHHVDAQTRHGEPPTLVKEQRADCYAGSYFAWAAGSSQRFQVSPEGLDIMLQALPIAADLPETDSGHGSSVERLWAFQQGFMRGADSCAAIDTVTVTAHRDGVQEVGGDANATFTPALVQSIGAATEAVTGVQADTSAIDIAALNAMSTPSIPGVKGDGSGGAALIAALVQPWLADQQISSPRSTACAVGAVARGMTGSGDVQLSAGDLDEMVIEILTEGLGATNAAGDMPASGFERVRGFLSGVYGGLEGCAG